MTKKFISDGSGSLKGIEIVSVNMEGGRPVDVSRPSSSSDESDMYPILTGRTCTRIRPLH